MAIKKEDLRIGNWIYVGHFDSMTKVKELFSHRVLAENITWEYDSDMVNPIPLSPEILEQCGIFKCDCGGWWTEGKMIHFNKDLSTTDSKPIKYLHQLQNLIYALTGKELTINLQSKSK